MSRRIHNSTVLPLTETAGKKRFLSSLSSSFLHRRSSLPFWAITHRSPAPSIHLVLPSGRATGEVARSSALCSDAWTDVLPRHGAQRFRQPSKICTAAPGCWPGPAVTPLPGAAGPQEVRLQRAWQRSAGVILQSLVS